jgi:alpha-tubulin suppressor-like RCC1 family protein
MAASIVACGGMPDDGVRSSETATLSVGTLSVGDARICAIAEGKVECFAPDSPLSSARAIEGLANVVEVASGHDHVCARREDGAVFCFGENAWGQLGDGTLSARATPVRVQDLPRATSIAAGFGKSCAAVEDGRVMCWGAQESDPHQLLVDAKPANRPVGIDGVQSASKVVLGGFHGCALSNEGAVMCFGANYFGQLGDGTTVASVQAVAAKNVDQAIDVAAGTHHTCALLRDGTVWCWGADIAGQLGAPATMNGSRAIAAKIEGIFDAKAIAAGGDHTCAIEDGIARCWGWNDLGQVAAGAATVVRAPVVATVDAVAAIAASDTHTCAMGAEGGVTTLTCWGSTR